MELTFLPGVLNCFICFRVMDSWELLMVLVFVLLNFPVKNTRSKVLLILLIWFGSIRTKQYLAGLSPHYLLRWSPPFMALRLLILLGKPLVQVFLRHQLLAFILSSESCSLCSKAPCLVRNFWMKLNLLLMNSLFLGNLLMILI